MALARVPIEESEIRGVRRRGLSGVEQALPAGTRWLEWPHPGRRHLSTAIHAETGLAWRRVIDAREAFVTAENIDDFSPDSRWTGLLSVDVDGMDYWILSAIHAVRPTRRHLRVQRPVRARGGRHRPYLATSTARRPSVDPLFRRLDLRDRTLGRPNTATDSWAGTSRASTPSWSATTSPVTCPRTVPRGVGLRRPIRQARDASGALTFSVARAAARTYARPAPCRCPSRAPRSRWGSRLDRGRRLGPPVQDRRRRRAMPAPDGVGAEVAEPCGAARAPTPAAERGSSTRRRITSSRVILARVPPTT